MLAGVPGRAQEENPDNPRDKEPHVRFICISAFEEDQEVVLASYDEEKGWKEYSTLILRAPLISEWLPIEAGEIHLALRQGEGLRSIGRFIYPKGTRRGLAILAADQERRLYQAKLIDPEQLEFKTGSVLVVNFSPTTALVMLGSNRVLVDPGGRVVSQPAVEPNGMYRMLVGYRDQNQKAVISYDRYIPGNPKSRDILFLLPDQTLGLSVFSLPEFGPFE